jgi:hypothetical protein
MVQRRFLPLKTISGKHTRSTDLGGILQRFKVYIHDSEAARRTLGIARGLWQYWPKLALSYGERITGGAMV